MGEPLNAFERASYKALTGGREVEPGQMADVFLCVSGRRSGKSRAMAVCCVYLSTLVDWSQDLSIGERGLAMFLAPSQKQAAYVFRYASAIIDHVPLLAGLVTGRTVDTLSLSTGVDLQVQAASHRTSRGPTCIAICLDETAYLHSGEDSANSDVEIVTALRPSLATTGGPLLMTSSPSQMEGVVYRTHKRHFGPQGDARTIVVQAATRDLNPKLSQQVIDRAYEDDPAAASAEYGGEFRQSVSAYLDRKVVERAIDDGIRQPLPGITYHAFVDVAGGSGSDSFVCAVGHLRRDDGADVCVIDAVWFVAPPFDPDDATKRCAAFLRGWNVNAVTGDSYAAMWPVTSFGKNGIVYSASPLSKSEIYLHTLPLWTAGRVRLIDNPKIVDQICGLRRKVGSGGRETVDHVRGAHDDLANAVAGVLWKLSPVFRPAVAVGPTIIMQPKADHFGIHGPGAIMDTDACFNSVNGIPPDGVENAGLMPYERGW
jgi:hypothetical protein